MEFLCRTKLYNFYLMINALRKLTFLMSFEAMLKMNTENLAYFFNYFGFNPPNELYNHLDQEEIKIKLKEIKSQMKLNFEKFHFIKKKLLEKYKKMKEGGDVKNVNGFMIDHIYSKVKESLHIVLLGLFQYLKKKMAYRFG